MDTELIKKVCKNIIALCDDLESTDQKAEINDIYIDLDLNKDSLDKLMEKL